MSYVQTILQPGEQLLFRSRIHWLIYLPGLCVLLLAGAVTAIGYVLVFSRDLSVVIYACSGLLVLIGLLTLGEEWLRRATTEIAVTDRRIIYKRGLIRRHTIEMNMEKVESVDVEQSVFCRIFNFGNILIHGKGSDVEPLHRIEDPLHFRSYVTAR